MRPIDVARKLGVSTSTLRKYEAFGFVPPVERTAAGYRVYTGEHLAYFTAARQMMPGFSLPSIGSILGEVMAQRTGAALWLATKAQAELQQERNIAERVVARLLRRIRPSADKQQWLTVKDVCRETGIPATTIRYWEKVGLLHAERRENNYRLFPASQAQRALAAYALKLAVYADQQRYFIDSIRADLEAFDYGDRGRIEQMTSGIVQHLDQLNRDRIRGVAALYRLCQQVESRAFDHGEE